MNFGSVLALAPASCLHALILTGNLQDAFLYGARNFSWSVSHCVGSVGHHLPTQIQNIPVIDVHTVMSGLKHQASFSWIQSNLSPPEQPITEPMHSAHQECQTVYMA